MDLKQIRKIFPDWPSELEVAKVPGHWLALAHAYFCAAQVLNEESNSALRATLAKEGKVIEKSNHIRLQTHSPAEFCLAFSLELAIKSILVSQGKLEKLTSEDALPFGNHMLHSLANEIDNLNLSQDDKKTLLWASKTVLHGKYPVPRKPSENKNGVKMHISFSDSFSRVQPLYKRLFDLSKTDKPPSAA